ncbi:MAG: bifunctional hydroxymethylpyrimidine kinase/phosphomethylpyrimidine kinase [Clostridia bacterium]|nr:bifunctional hydroxymethylpyrimidine kinase/phosphomethylpyrimidine kinase [Clostridia bacterium]
MRTALTIAGSDSSGGAGIQADIKTMSAHGVYAMSAITALTAQNTIGVCAIAEVTPGFLKSQIDSVYADIRPDAVKTGMVAGGALIEVIADRLTFYGAQNVVIDPVMIATSGSRLLEESAIGLLKSRLLPLAAVVTPNIPEAMVLSGMEIRTKADMERAAKRIERECRCCVLLKGGHQVSDADDLLCQGGALRWFKGERIDNPNTHGTGCTLSSAIASNLALGYPLEDAIARAKDYISGALRAGLDLGLGSGPLDHMYGIR